MRLGIDVGGTNTDAVLLEGTEIRSKVKTATTADVTWRIVAAIEHALDGSEVDPDGLGGVMIGTIHFANAVIERTWHRDAVELAPTGPVVEHWSAVG